MALDSENSDDTTALNRDTEHTEKDLFTVDRKQGDIDVTVDHRLLTEEGRKDIKEDFKRTELIGDAVVETASEDSVGLIGDKEQGVSGFFDHLNTKNKYFDATKEFLTAEANSEHATAINDPNATPEQKKEAHQALINHIAVEFGIKPSEVKLANIGQKGAFVSGVVYFDDSEHSRLEDAVNTVGNESSHMIDAANAPKNQGENYVDNREGYSTIMGNDTEDYMSFNFSNRDKGSFGGWNTQNGTSSSETVKAGTNEFSLIRPDAQKWDRLPTPTEKGIINKLAGADKGKQRELLAAGCALINCSQEYPLGSDERAYYSQLEKEGKNNSEAQQVLLNYSEKVIGEGVYHSAYGEKTIDNQFRYTKNDFHNDSETFVQNTTSQLLYEKTDITPAVADLIQTALYAKDGSVRGAIKAAKRVGKNKGQNGVDDYSGQQTATVGEGSVLKPKTNESGTYVKREENHQNGVSSGQDPNKLGQAPPSGDVDLKVTRESVQTELNKLPDGQGDNYYVRQNTDGSFSAVRKGKDMTSQMKVTEDGNLYTPIKTQSNSEAQIAQNRIDGKRREIEVETELKKANPNASVQSEQFLRDRNGDIVIDEVTGERRRIDHVVIESGRVTDAVETTSLTANKDAQKAKEDRIRESGGNFVKDRDTRCTIPLDCEIRIDRRE